MNPTTKEPTATVDDDRTGMTVAILKQAILENLRYVVGKDPESATEMDYFMAVAYTVRDRILARWLATKKIYVEHDVRVVCYLSAEFLMGPHLANNLLNLNVEQAVRQACTELGIDLDRTIAEEREPGLGNGGLGRLAACYLDSLATMGIPAIGYGIRYEFGMFQQEIHDGWQVELTDYWLRYGNPWEIRRPEESVDVAYGGHTESWTDAQAKLQGSLGSWHDGQRNSLRHARTGLRLWSIERSSIVAIGSGRILSISSASTAATTMVSVAAKNFAENISKVLYPNDDVAAGKQLRLEQQYFFTSCALQDMIRLHLAAGRSDHELSPKNGPSSSMTPIPRSVWRN